MPTPIHPRYVPLMYPGHEKEKPQHGTSGRGQRNCIVISTFFVVVEAVPWQGKERARDWGRCVRVLVLFLEVGWRARLVAYFGIAWVSDDSFGAYAAVPVEVNFQPPIAQPQE